MSRTSEAEVRTVVDTEAATDVIEGFIADANLEVNERVNAANVGYSDERMAKLEKYLSAHLLRFLYDRQETTGSVANVQTSYAGAFGEGLTATSAGQVVLDTDTADVFSAELNPAEDDGPDDGGLFVTRDGFTDTASPGVSPDSGRVEGTEHRKGGR